MTVRIVAGEITCSDAEELLGTYYREVPTRGEGSGGYLRLEEWSCSSSSAAAFASSGLATTCTTAAGAKVVTEGDPAAPPTTQAAPTTPTPTPGVTTATPGPDGSYCDRIDAGTLEQMFPDGQLDEQLCRSYMQGE